MKFGNQLFKYLDNRNVSINYFAKICGLSPPYFTKIKHNPEIIPLEKSFFKILVGLQNIGVSENQFDKMIEYLANNKKHQKKIEKRLENGEYGSITNLSYIDYVKLDLNKFYQDNIQVYEDSKKYLKKNLTENKVAVNKKNEFVLIEDFEDNKPFFDLEWLLSQDIYQLFYSNSMKISDKVLPNMISDIDKQIIKNLIKTYFETKYDEDILSVHHAQNKVVKDLIITDEDYMKLLDDEED